MDLVSTMSILNFIRARILLRPMQTAKEISVATPMTYARYCGHPQGVIYGYESQYWDGLMPRLQMMGEDYGNGIRGLRFASAWSMRLSGYSSSYFAGDIAGRQTVGDIKREG